MLLVRTASRRSLTRSPKRTPVNPPWNRRRNPLSRWGIGGWSSPR